jgi:hypothetical protein
MGGRRPGRHGEGDVVRRRRRRAIRQVGLCRLDPGREDGRVPGSGAGLHHCLQPGPGPVERGRLPKDRDEREQDPEQAARWRQPPE